MDNRSISVTQTVMLFMLAIGITNHVIIVPLILEAAGRDAWLAVMAALPAYLLWCVPLFAIMRSTRQEALLDWLRARYSGLIVMLVKIPMILYLLSILYITVRDTTTWTRVAYLPKTPFPLVAIIVLLCGFAAARSGLRAVAVTAGFLLPGVVVLGYFVMAANFQFKDYAYLQPMLEKGLFPVWKGTVYALGGLFELILLPFIRQYIGKPIRLRVLLLLGVVLAGLIAGPTTGSIAIFGPIEAADQRYPAFEQWRMVLIGKFVSHLDFFSIYQWIAGSFIRLALGLFLLADLLKPGRQADAGSSGGQDARPTGEPAAAGRSGWWQRWRLALVCLLLAGGVTLIPMSDPRFARLMYQYYFPAIAVFFCVYPLLLLLLFKLGGGRKRHEAATIH